MRAVAAALLAGGSFVLADWLVAGAPAEPLAMVGWSVVGGGFLAGGGLLAGAAARRLVARAGGPGADRFAVAGIVALAHGSSWAAIASKEWLMGAGAFHASLLLALVALGAVVTAALAARLRPLVGALLCGVLALPGPWLARPRGAVDASPSPPSPVALDPVRDAAADPAAPCILLVVIDTLRADHVLRGPFSPGTPTLDRLAREGVEFAQAVSSAAWTLPAHGSLFTGVAPARHGALTPTACVGAELPTLAGRLREGGYATAAFTGGGFLVAATGLARGFDRFDGEAELHPHALRSFQPWILRIARNRFMPLWPVVNALPASGGLARVGARAGEWLVGRADRHPFFLFLHTYQVHDYFAFDAAIDGTARPGFAGRFRDRLWVHPAEIGAGITDEEAAAFHRIYTGRIAAADRALEPLLALATEAAGPRGLVTIVTSDHGEGFDAASGRLGHGGRLHDDLLRVPLVVHASAAPAATAASVRLPRGLVVPEQVALVDLLPTVLELAGLPPPAGLDGSSLLPLVRRPADATHAEIAWSEDGAGESRQVAVRTPRFKVVRAGTRLESFELAVDPGERADLGAALPEGLRALLERLEARHIPVPSASATYDAATLDQLRRLGYVK